jgi:hypothetical protein
MKLYTVEQVNRGVLIKDYGEMNIKQIEELGRSLIGDTFKGEEDLISDMEYIKSEGEEDWIITVSHNDFHYIEIRLMEEENK